MVQWFLGDSTIGLVIWSHFGPDKTMFRVNFSTTFLIEGTENPYPVYPSFTEDKKLQYSNDLFISIIYTTSWFIRVKVQEIFSITSYVNF